MSLKGRREVRYDEQIETWAVQNTSKEDVRINPYKHPFVDLKPGASRTADFIPERVAQMKDDGRLTLTQPAAPKVPLKGTAAP